MLIYGAGGHAAVIISILQEIQIPIHAVFSDNPATAPLCGVYHPIRYQPALWPDEALIIAIGKNEDRKHVAGLVKHPFANVTHPGAMVGPSVRWGTGTVVMQQAIAQVESKIGDHVILNTGCIVEHECRVGDFVHVGPGAVLCGNVDVGKCSLIGAGSVICPNLTIGENCLIAAGSVVTRNIPSGSIVRGNPARIIRNAAKR